MNTQQVKQQTNDRAKRLDGKLAALVASIVALLPTISATGKDGYGQAAREANAICTDLGAAVDAALRKKYFPAETPKPKPAATLIKNPTPQKGSDAKFNVGI